MTSKKLENSKKLSNLDCRCRFKKWLYSIYWKFSEDKTALRNQ
jgi:hypothetical protein